QSVLNSLAENGGLIRADGGMVVMTAGAKDALLASVVNNTGVIEARTVENHEGVITLLGGMAAGTVNVGGTLDASAPSASVPSPSGGGLGWGNNGGFIETSAAHVHIADSARVTTVAPSACTEPCRSGNSGTWLIDPVDFTIAASGGDMTGAAVNAALAGGNFTIMSTSGAGGTAGNINVNDAVTWAANLFTLNAQNNININANLNASGTASLALEFGQGAVAAGNTSNIVTGNGAAVNLPASTINFTTKQGSDGAVKNYTVITTLGLQNSVTTADLQGMSGGLGLNYALGADIVATPTSLGAWYAAGGFAPVGTSAAKFTGTFDGLGHTISNLTINRPATSNVGLFGYINTGSTIRNVGMVGGNVTGSNYTGGLAGRNFGGSISNSYSTGNVTGASYTGGLVGNNGDGFPGSSISNSYATGNVTGTGWGAGGLVGGSIYGTVSNSYATGTVIGNNNVGGLVGSNRNGNTVSNSYATGQVTGARYAGGLVGADMGSGAIETSYSTGKVTATTSNGGGLLGKGNAASVTNSFWDITTSTQATSAGGTGIATTALMHAQASFIPAGSAVGEWDFTNTWVMYEGFTSPLLRSLMTPLTVTANNMTKTYDGVVSTATGVTYSTTPNANLLGALNWDGATHVGSYTPSGLYSNQQGYIISYVNGVLTINPAPLTITANISLPPDAASIIAQVTSGKKADLMASNYRQPEVINEGILLPVQLLAAEVNSPGVPETLQPPLPVPAQPIADPGAKSAAVEHVAPQTSHATAKIPVKTASVICSATNANSLVLCAKKMKQQERIKQAIKPATKPAIKLGMSRELRPVAGDQLAESFHESPWLDNSGINNAGRSRSDSQYARQMSGISIMSNPIFFFIP
ncbi:MAG: GLUG motif-containing protein, partial [Methylobacter sp.]|nr:GLUG motif-containing protein [Methylobacter sp.]